jgi:hypothetical protein
MSAIGDSRKLMQTEGDALVVSAGGEASEAWFLGRRVVGSAT